MENFKGKLFRERRGAPWFLALLFVHVMGQRAFRTARNASLNQDF
jgi:hypothetical protein